MTRQRLPVLGFRRLERFQGKWTPVRVKKTRQIKNLEPRFDSIEAGKALSPLHEARAVTIQIDAASGTACPLAKSASASRIEFSAAARNSGG